MMRSNCLGLVESEAWKSKLELAYILIKNFAISVYFLSNEVEQMRVFGTCFAFPETKPTWLSTIESVTVWKPIIVIFF